MTQKWNIIGDIKSPVASVNFDTIFSKTTVTLKRQPHWCPYQMSQKDIRKVQILISIFSYVTFREKILICIYILHSTRNSWHDSIYDTYKYYLKSSMYIVKQKMKVLVGKSRYYDRCLRLYFVLHIFKSI